MREFLFDSAWILSAYTLASSTISPLRRLISFRITIAPLLTASSTIFPNSAFEYPFDGAFFITCIVLASVVFTSVKPKRVSSAVLGASIPSKLRG